MNEKIKSICIFASASNNIDKKYFEIAYNLGFMIAKEGYDIIYGASNLGLMGQVVSGANKFGTNITGVMPQRLYDFGIEKGACTNFIITKEMRQRKAKMDELSDGIIALPGGFGTLEELSEMIVQKQLGYCNKPIVILNSYQYYDNLIKFFDEMIKQNFAPKNSTEIYHISDTIEDDIKYINNYRFDDKNYIKEKLKNENINLSANIKN